MYYSISCVLLYITAHNTGQNKLMFYTASVYRIFKYSYSGHTYLIGLGVIGLFGRISTLYPA